MTDFDEAPTALLDATALQARFRVGRVLKDKWKLDALLGVGGMAAVYAATHRNGSRAAVKILHRELCLSTEVLRRFAREGHAANAVAHEGAVKVIDDDTAEDGSPFLVSELLDGETLEGRRVRNGGKLTEDEVLSAADQLLDVLVAAHAKGIVHRDLKPENVFLTRTGQVKVLDFGIARLREMSTASSATRVGTSMGTPAFMAPEQARALWDEVDGRTDLWAVGATMFNLLTGQLVHEGRTVNEILLAAMTKPAPPLASVLPGVAPTVADLVDRALAFERENRWPDAARMQEGVRRAYYDRTGKPITTAPKLTVPPSVPNRTLPSLFVETAPPREVPAAGMTAQPVSRTGGSASPGFSRSTVGALALGAVVALGVLAGGIGILVSASRTSSLTGGSASSPVAAAAAPPAPLTLATDAAVTAPQASEASAVPPTVAATDLPIASSPPPPTAVPVPPAGAVNTKPSSGPASAGGPPHAPKFHEMLLRPGCDPPYVVDPATNKKVFKEGCFAR